MIAAEEQTLYDVLEIEPRASAEEIRAAHARAAEAFGPESIAVYALVGEAQLEALRERLAEAAEVLLDPARRASYDRSIGLQGPGMLWEEDDEEDEVLAASTQDDEEEAQEEPDEREESEERGEPTGPGPHALAADGATLEPEPLEEPAPEQRALDLDLTPAPGPFGRAMAEHGARDVAPEPEAVAPPTEPPSAAEAQPLESPPPVEASAGAVPSLHADWAAAVTETVPAPPEPEPISSAPSLPTRTPLPSRPPPLPRASLGLRRAGSADARPSAAHPSPGMRDDEGELDGRARIDIPPDAEFNGELLRRVREAHGLSLQQVAERTRITRIHLENVEADRYDNLPATVYLRGILVNLARELRLDPARVSKSYLLVAQRAQTRGQHD